MGNSDHGTAYTYTAKRAHLLAEDVEALLVAVDRVVVEEPTGVPRSEETDVGPYSRAMRRALRWIISLQKNLPGRGSKFTVQGSGCRVQDSGIKAH